MNSHTSSHSLDSILILCCTISTVLLYYIILYILYAMLCYMLYLYYIYIIYHTILYTITLTYYDYIFMLRSHRPVAQSQGLDMATLRHSTRLFEAGWVARTRESSSKPRLWTCNEQHSTERRMKRAHDTFSDGFRSSRPLRW